MATKAQTLADPQSCLNRAADDEEIFVLRANDPLAPLTVAEWARLYEQRRGATEKSTEAWSCAERMRDWRRANDFPGTSSAKKVPVLKDEVKKK